ncbi:MAG: hypothetical protein WCK75_01270 [Elusimicrobiota bacterium]
MQIKLSETVKSLKHYVYGLWPMAYGLTCIAACGFARPPRIFRKGQTTVEYLLMLAVVVGMTLIIGILFHKKILGGMFSLIGMVMGAGKPT